MTRTKPKSRKSFFQRYWQLLVVVFAFLTVGVASAALVTPKSPARHIAAFDENVAVYRPADRAWIETSLEALQPLDFLLKDERAYHVSAPYTAAAGQAQAVPLGQVTRAELERHLDNYDPEDTSYPQSDVELVYAKWEGTDLRTFQPLGKLADGDLFQHNGREFITRVALDGSRSVKPAGNVISQVTGVWSEHHDNQIHLTLFFPEIGETNKIITTHEHPFFVPKDDETGGEWITAANLKVGMALQTCDDTPARITEWVLVDEPFTAWNIEVAHSHTYYVADPNNPDAPPVLVHNDCLPENWTPRSITNPNNWNGCEQCARDIRAQLGGGDIVRIRPEGGAPSLGGYRGANPGWAYHEVVVKDGRVYDAFGPRGGVTIDEYKNLFQYSDAIDFGF